MAAKPFDQLGRWDKFLRLTLAAGFISMIIGVSDDQLGAILVGAFLLTFPWILTLGWRLGGSLGNEIKVASRGIPSPESIAAELQKEWGRQPTVQEVAAVHQMLQSRHNQALLNTGIGFGALYLMKKHTR